MKEGIIRVLIANVINLVFSLLTNFILPKYLSIDSYAAIKTFQLYSSYTGILSLGYLDGIYLKYGGKQIESIDSKELQTSTSTGRVFQIIITIILVLIGIYIKNALFIAFAASVVPVNMAYYYKNLYQAVGEFGKYGKILNATTALVFIANIILLFIVKTDSYMIYIGAYVVAYYLIWFVMEAKSSSNEFGKLKSQIFSWKELVSNVRSGILLLLGNLTSVLMTSLDRWCVKLLMDTASFAQYSFAVSIEGFLNVAVSPVTVTLYNYFCKEHTNSELVRIRNCVMIFASLIVACAFPARFILELYLKEYLHASNVMFILFAAQLFYTIIKSVYVNLYKAQKKQTRYFTKMVSTVVLGLVFNIIIYSFFKAKESFAFGTLLSAVCWYLLCLTDFRDLTLKGTELLYPFAETALFLFCGLTLNSIIGLCVYCSSTILLTMMMMHNDIIYIAKQVLSILDKYRSYFFENDTE